MYLDAVLSAEGNVLFNATPTEVKAWVSDRVVNAELVGACVMRGYNLRAYTVDEYLARIEA